MTYQAISAVSLPSEPSVFVGMDDVSEALRWDEMQGRVPENPEGLSNEYDELDRDAFGGVFT